MLTNAAVPPLHAWLSDAYPRASIFGTVFLAAFTTKAAVYALVRGFPGVDALVWLGVAMALFGVVYAVLENDIRRLLAYHIISQVGYMVAGVGLGTALALNGTSAHAFAHIFYKGLLMMSAGAVIYATGRGKLTELGQLAKPMKWTLILMMIGAFSISGVPFFNGFVSKSMIVSAAADAGRAPIELLLLLASMGTFLHTGLKLPWYTFFARDHGAQGGPAGADFDVRRDGAGGGGLHRDGLMPGIHALRAASLRGHISALHRSPLPGGAPASHRHGARLLDPAGEALQRADHHGGCGLSLPPAAPGTRGRRRWGSRDRVGAAHATRRRKRPWTGAWKRARRSRSVGAAASPSVQSTVVFLGVAVATVLALLFSR
jgi:hypothetical protein